jgi:putative redox protein
MRQGRALAYSIDMIEVKWKGKMAFCAEMPDGTGFLMDTNEEAGGEGKGPSPVETLLSSVAACSAMDVIAILKKMRQDVTGYHVEVVHTRAPKGEWPRPVTGITMRHVLDGENLDPEAVAKAVTLSDEKYCSVMATLRSGPELKSEIVIREKAGT